MSIDFQTLNDALIAIGVTVGIAVAVALAFIAIGAFAQRGKARTGKLAVSRDVTAPAQHPTQTDNARELVLR